MKKFRAYAIISASKFIGEIEAENKEQAEDLAWDHENCYNPTLCHHCSYEMDLGDIDEILIEEVEEKD